MISSLSMKLPFFALCLLASCALGDDLALAKKSFNQFVEHSNNNDPRIFDLLAPGCSGNFVLSDGTLKLETSMPAKVLRKFMESAIERKEEGGDSFENVKFDVFDGGVDAYGTLRPGKKDDKDGRFTVTLKKDGDGAMKVHYILFTFPLEKTPIRCHDLFEFVMPGEWQPEQVEKLDVGDGITLHPGAAKSEAGTLSYIAFDEEGVEPEDKRLEQMPMVVSEPIITAMRREGGRLTDPFVGKLTPENKDQVYFHFTLQGPKEDVPPIYINGIALRTKKRIYTIHTVSAVSPNVELWRNVAKSFKEL